MDSFTFRKVEIYDTDLMEQIYRLRFDVYCKERQFIKEENYPDCLEKDSYDSQSIHFAAIDSEGEAIGAMRLILPGQKKLPVQLYCPDVNIDSQLLRQRQCAEISRLVISPKLRKSKVPARYRSLQNTQEPKVRMSDFMRRSRLIALGLHQEIAEESKRRGIQEWYSLMEKSLWLLLRIHGFHFHCIGEEVDVFGPVNPYVYVGNIYSIEENLNQFAQYP
ncbi:MAG: PEP-CTERM/exosortase system-associated acyltransferase [Candidatus Omnitrophica bacterium]|nr:PEP-CTERM/exosortase system-associated acyltransferase [Candidatus Omnitrophota bacterium]